MKQEEKELLLKDLCGRLPYKVIVEFVSYEGEEKPWFGELSCKDLDCFIHDIRFIEIKPYLFPLSSMTEEQKIECFRGVDIELDDYNEIWSKFPITNDDIILTNVRDWLKVIDWLNANYFDYRDLIPKGLALDATGFNIY